MEAISFPLSSPGFLTTPVTARLNINTNYYPRLLLLIFLKFSVFSFAS